MNKHQPELGHDIEKLLTEITPQADAHFQEKLEQRVLAAYLQKKEGDKVKANGHLVTCADFLPKLNVKNNRQRRWSISLVATLLMVAFVGLMLMSIEGRPRGGYTGASLITTPTVTTSPSGTPEEETFRPVVVAIMHIPQGAILSADMLEVQQWKQDYIPLTSFTHLEDLIGAMTRTEIPSKSPIVEAQVILPDDLAMIDFPLEEHGLRPVVVTTRDLVRGTILSNEMLDIVYWPADGLPTGSYPVSTLLIGQRLVTDLRANSPILTRHLDVDSSTLLDAGRVGIAVPMPDDRFFYGFQVGDTISITASFLFVETYEVNGVQITPSTDNEVFPQLVVQEVIPDAKIVNLGGTAVTEESDLQVMVLAVTSEQAEVLTWLLDSQIPLQYRIVIPVSETD